MLYYCTTFIISVTVAFLWGIAKLLTHTRYPIKKLCFLAVAAKPVTPAKFFKEPILLVDRITS